MGQVLLFPTGSPTAGRVRVLVTGNNLRVVATMLGELDAAGAANTRSRLRTAVQVACGHPLMVDLRGLTVRDLAGWRALRAARDEAAEAGTDIIFLAPSRGRSRRALTGWRAPSGHARRQPASDADAGVLPLSARRRLSAVPDLAAGPTP